MLPFMTDWKLCSQPNTKWVSNDRTIELYVDGDSRVTGTMNVNGDLIEIYLTEGPLRSTEMHVYSKSVLEDEILSYEDKYEFWVCTYRSEKEFVATVKKTSFYKVGQQIIFHRVDD